jgi:hypothetical protein
MNSTAACYVIPLLLSNDYSGNQIEKNEMGGACSTYGGGERSYRVLVGNLRERSRRRWDENIKMGLHEVGCGGTDWIELAQDRDRWREVLRAVIKYFVQ